MDEQLTIPFDATYFAHGCGRPYRRDTEWLGFFGDVAQRIVDDIRPSTVLDAGCAMGFLVETLRERGVEAEGIDVSDYAIAQAHESVRPFVRVGSLAEPIRGRYDLITCIEVLEHMPPADADRAIEYLCAATDDLLFSSSPEDYGESTHVNVRPPEAWAEAFARQGFYRDVDFDASFITPWAVRFRRTSEPPHRIVRGYERRYWMLYKENHDLRRRASETRDELAAAREARDELTRLHAHLAAVERGRAMRAINRASGIRDTITRLLRRATDGEDG